MPTPPAPWTLLVSSFMIPFTAVWIVDLDPNFISRADVVLVLALFALSLACSFGLCMLGLCGVYTPLKMPLRVGTAFVLAFLLTPAFWAASLYSALYVDGCKVRREQCRSARAIEAARIERDAPPNPRLQAEIAACRDFGHLYGLSSAPRPWQRDVSPWIHPIALPYSPAGY